VAAGLQEVAAAGPLEVAAAGPSIAAAGPKIAAGPSIAAAAAAVDQLLVHMESSCTDSSTGWVTLVKLLLFLQQLTQKKKIKCKGNKNMQTKYKVLSSK
jgi:hypothetical protein